MIPAVAHFVWFGKTLPYAYILGVRSAAMRGGFSQVLIHHADELERSTALDEALALPNVELSRLTLETLKKAPIERADELVELFQKLEQPAAKANMMRAAILANQGGVYLDTDTITLKDFDLLRQEHSAFCGAEHIALPSTVKDSRNPLVWAKPERCSYIATCVAERNEAGIRFAGLSIFILRWLIMRFWRQHRNTPSCLDFSMAC